MRKYLFIYWTYGHIEAAEKIRWGENRRKLVPSFPRSAPWFYPRPVLCLSSFFKGWHI